MNGPRLDDAARHEWTSDPEGLMVWWRPVTWREILMRQVADEYHAWPAPRVVGQGFADAAGVQWLARRWADSIAMSAVAGALVESRSWREAGARLRAMLAAASAGRADYTRSAWLLAERLAPALRVSTETTFEMLRSVEDGGDE